ncbi:MAG TPA: hypothetical protein VHP35_07585, partial [Terriglobia bacterium]|nr:hypothetical protein [Terriglobia bacterium]
MTLAVSGIDRKRNSISSEREAAASKEWVSPSFNSDWGRKGGDKLVEEELAILRTVFDRGGWKAGK